MTAVWHFVRTDVRRLRWVIAAWLFLVAGATIFDAVVPFLSQQTQIAFIASIGLTMFVLVATLLLFSVLLIPLIVQADPAVGTDAFWMTRPIDPRSLWIAKLALAGILGLAVPVLAQVVLLAISRIAPLEIARLAAESALLRLFWIACFMALAALTPGIARFLLLGAAVAVGLAIVVNGAFALARSAQIGFPPVPLELHLADPTPELLAIAGVAVAGLVLVAVQYRIRLRSRSVPAGLLVLGVTAGLAALWPWNTFEPRLTVPSWALAPERVRLTADPGTVAFDDVTPSIRSGDREWRSATARFSLGTMERGWSGSVNLVDASLSLGQTVLQSPGGYGGHAGQEGRGDDAQAVPRDLLGVRWVGEPFGWISPSAGPAHVMIVREDEFQRHAPARGAYHGRYRIDLSEETVAAVLPLAPGASYQDGVHRFVIEQVTRSSQGVVILFQERDASSVFDAAAGVSQEFFLRNVAQAEAIRGTDYETGANPGSALGGAFFLYSGASGLRNRRISMEFQAHVDNDSVKWSRDPGWFADVELVVLRLRPAGSVIRTLDIADFPLQAGPVTR